MSKNKQPSDARKLFMKQKRKEASKEWDGLDERTKAAWSRFAENEESNKAFRKSHRKA